MNWQRKKRNYVYPNTSLLLSHNKILLSNDVRARTMTDTRHLVREEKEGEGRATLPKITYIGIFMCMCILAT